MRDPNRIDPFLERLGKVWKQVPDWRFGQLIENVFDSIDGMTFFMEDEEILKYFEKFLKTKED